MPVISLNQTLWRRVHEFLCQVRIARVLVLFNLQHDLFTDDLPIRTEDDTLSESLGVSGADVQELRPVFTVVTFCRLVCVLGTWIDYSFEHYRAGPEIAEETIFFLEFLYRGLLLFLLLLP